MCNSFHSRVYPREFKGLPAEGDVFTTGAVAGPPRPGKNSSCPDDPTAYGDSALLSLRGVRAA